MGFLIKSAFWLSLVLLVIPFGNKNNEPTVGAIEAFLAARAVIDDVSGLCERRPQACETGRSAFHTIGIRARESARIAYDMLGEEAKEETGLIDMVDSGTDEELHTGSVSLPNSAFVPVPTARALAIQERQGAIQEGQEAVQE